MKRFFSSVAIVFAIGVFAAALPACTTTANPPGTIVSAQDFDKAYLQANTLLAAVTDLATTAVKADKLKGKDADNTIAVIKQAQAGLLLARGMSDPQLGITKLSAMVATLSAMQTYLLPLAAK